MTSNLAVSDPHTHVAQFYGSDVELVDAVTDYLAAALADGDVALVIATPGAAQGFSTSFAPWGWTSPQWLKPGSW